MSPSPTTERTRGQQRERSEEVHRDTQRSGARTAHRAYPEREASGTKAAEARILLKADVSEGGEGWSDTQIAAAMETSVDTVARTRQRLVEEGLQAALIRKHSPNSARRRIFDGAAEARLIALACSKPPAGRARWTLQLLEEAVVELKIVERTSDNTIGRTLKKTLSSRI